MSYTISLLRDDLVDVRVTEPIEAEPALGTGVEVRITELDRTYRSLEPRRSVQALSEVFALYLTDYSEAGVYVESEKLDPSSQIAERRTLDLEPIVAGDKEHAVQVELIEWKAASERWFFLCGPEGFPFLRTTPRFHTPGYQFSAYLRSSYVDVLQEAGVLELSEMDPALQEACDAAAELIKAHFRDKEVESSKTEIEQWKTEEIYPYRSEPQTSVAKAERKVFDIAAVDTNTEVLRAKNAAMKMLGLGGDHIEDILISLGTQYHLIRPLAANPAVFVYVALERKAANLGLARLTLKSVETTLKI